MHTALTRLRARFGRPMLSSMDDAGDGAACSWDELRATYEEQAARGVPEAIEGLELIEQGRWPSSGRHRDGSDMANG